MTHLVIIPRPQTILLILIFCPDAADARLVVEAGISPPISPGGEVEEDDEVRDHIVVKGEDPLKAEEAMAASLRVKSPSDINHQTSRKRWNSSTVSDSGTTWPSLPSCGLSDQPVSVSPAKRLLSSNGETSQSTTQSTSQIVQKFQREMTERFLQFQRESEVRFLAWEQERWRLEQNLLERWRTEKEMFALFCGLVSDCSAALLGRDKQGD